MPVGRRAQVGPDEIIERLGEGGMGVVYKARDPRLGRMVAIKVLPPAKVADAGRKRRFIQEAKAASALNHPNIITIYDIGSEDRADFIVKEYVAGRSLDRDIMVTDDDRTVKLLDFGLAKLVENVAPGVPLTEDGAVLGTVSYMSPEQAEIRSN